MVRLNAFGGQSHDETGTGSAARMATKADAESLACKKALQGGVRRLVKLFATSLGQQRLRQIEEEAKLTESRSRSMCR